MNLLNYPEFLEQVCKQIKDYFPERYQDAKVELNHIVKTNDQEMDGLVIRREQDKVVPQIYLNGYFELYENGVSLSEILMAISSTYFQSTVKPFENLPENVLDYEQIKDRIMVQLVNQDMNQALLEKVPGKGIADTDLAAVFRIPLQTDERGTATIRVTNELMASWGMDLEIVYQDALANTVRENPAQLTTLSSIMGELLELPIFQNQVKWEKPETCEMEPYEQYILTNPSQMFGAATLLYPEVLQQLSDNMQSSFFILPSSIHELLLMKDNGELNAAELQAMVMGVNQDAVSMEERLSDEVYYYDGKEHSLSMATVKEETAELKQHLQSAIPAGPELDIEHEL
jgi:Neuraminidase (sialidase)